MGIIFERSPFLMAQRYNTVARESRIAAIIKTHTKDIYRMLLADEIKRIKTNLTDSDKVLFEEMLRMRYIDIRTYEKLISQLKKQSVNH